MMMVVTQLKSLVRRCHPAIPFSETTHVLVTHQPEKTFKASIARYYHILSFTTKTVITHR